MGGNRGIFFALPRLGKVVDARQTVDQTMKFQGRSVLDHVPGTGGSIQNGVHTRFNALVVVMGYIEGRRLHLQECISLL